MLEGVHSNELLCFDWLLFDRCLEIDTRSRLRLPLQSTIDDYEGTDQKSEDDAVFQGWNARACVRTSVPAGPVRASPMKSFRMLRRGAQLK